MRRKIVLLLRIRVVFYNYRKNTENYTEMKEVERVGLAVRVSASFPIKLTPRGSMRVKSTEYMLRPFFSKKIPHIVGRLRPGPRLVGR